VQKNLTDLRSATQCILYRACAAFCKKNDAISKLANDASAHNLCASVRRFLSIDVLRPQMF